MVSAPVLITRITGPGCVCHPEYDPGAAIALRTWTSVSSCVFSSRSYPWNLDCTWNVPRFPRAMIVGVTPEPTVKLGPFPSGLSGDADRGAAESPHATAPRGARTSATLMIGMRDIRQPPVDPVHTRYSEGTPV